MRKSLLLFIVLACSQLNSLFAQNLFSVPDTVCVRQPIFLVDSFTSPAESYYWGFCSGYLLDAAQGIYSGPLYNTRPTAIEVAKDGENYYAFIATTAPIGGVADTLIMLDFGNSLSNEPDTINLGTLNDVMPLETSKIFSIKA
jgi:hypothetical protein